VIAATVTAPMPPANADALLVARARVGDRAAFATLYQRHIAAIYNLVLHLTGSAADTEELTQEIFYQAYRSLPKFQGRSAFLTWLFRIATNQALMYRKRCAVRRRRTVLPGPDDRDPLLTAAAPGLGPAECAEQREQFRALIDAVQHLPAGQRVAIVLGPIQGRSYQEISEILEIPTDAVKGRLHRARVNLRAALAGKHPGT
jgi:RNA polymerase sigma-70 factor (ECF subfamily)